MIVRMPYKGKGIVGLKTKGEEEKQRYIRYLVDSISIQRCLEETRGNKWVVAIDYEGAVEELYGIEPKEDYKPVIVKIKYKSEGLEEEISRVPEWVRVVVEYPEGYTDMRAVRDLVKSEPRVRVCGGYFCRLEGCNIGCITEDDIPKKISDTKKLYVTKGCGCVQLTVDLEDLDNYELIHEVEKVEIENLIDLLKM